MNDEKRRSEPGDTMRDGVRSILGVLGALKDAVEETFDDLTRTPEPASEEQQHARDDARDTLRRAQETVQEKMDEMRGRLDFVTRREFDALEEKIAALSTRLDALEKNGAAVNAAAPSPDDATESGPRDDGAAPAPDQNEDQPGQAGPTKFRFEVE